MNELLKDSVMTKKVDPQLIMRILRDHY